jgi:hypothetical protein
LSIFDTVGPRLAVCWFLAGFSFDWKILLCNKIHGHIRFVDIDMSSHQNHPGLSTSRKTIWKDVHVQVQAAKVILTTPSLRRQYDSGGLDAVSNAAVDEAIMEVRVTYYPCDSTSASYDVIKPFVKPFTIVLDRHIALHFPSKLHVSLVPQEG